MSCQTGKINLVELLINEIATLYMSEQCSDITLYVKGQKIPAHRSIIGGRCEYLKTYFSNDLNEPNQTKFELDVPLEAFQVLLKYFYTGQMNLSKIKNLETLIQILNLIEEYCLFYLKTHFENYFKQIISVENACRLLEIAKTYQLKELENKSLNFIDTNADQILISESFRKISKNLLEDILTRNTFIASSELSIFHAIVEWSKHVNQNMENVIHLVELPLIPLKELLKIRKSGTLTGEKLLDAIEKQMEIKSTQRSDIQEFGQLPQQNENVVSSKYNARTLQGEFQYGDHIKYKHAIGDDSSIIIELGQIFIINHLKMELLGSSYGYFIQTSTDQKKWKSIVNYSSCTCFSKQNLYFPSKPVKYIKIVGTLPLEHNLVVGKFEAYYRENIPEIRNGIIVPNEPVEYQPYYIGSIRFYINSNKKYKFNIKTSLNDKDWVKIVDKNDEYVNGWQTFQFSSKSIVYIKITLTDCSTGLFYNFGDIIKKFESPSSV